MPEPAPRGRNPYDTGRRRARPRRHRALHRPPGLARPHAARDGRARPRRPRGRRDRRRPRQLPRAVGAGGAGRGRPARRRAWSAGTASRSGCPTASTGCSRSGARSSPGAVVVPVNTRFKDAEAQYVIDDSGASFTFGALPDGEPVGVEDLGPDDLAAIFYTSGTTGFPKGAMTSHANFLANSENAVRCIGVDREAGNELATIVNVPLFHVTGCNSQLIVCHELGGARVRLDQPDGPRGLPAHRRRGARGHAHLGAGDLPRADAPPRLRRRPTSARSGTCPTAARRSPPTPCTRSWRRSRTRASATASGSPRRRR